VQLYIEWTIEIEVKLLQNWNLIENQQKAETLDILYEILTHTFGILYLVIVVPISADLWDLCYLMVQNTYSKHFHVFGLHYAVYI